MTELTAEQVVIEVWCELMGDADLLEGISVGRFVAFMEALVSMFEEHRAALIDPVPLGLVMRFTDLEGKTFTEQLEVSREYLKLKTVDEFLDRLSGISVNDE